VDEEAAGVAAEAAGAGVGLGDLVEGGLGGALGVEAALEDDLDRAAGKAPNLLIRNLASACILNKLYVVSSRLTEPHRKTAYPLEGQIVAPSHAVSSSHTRSRPSACFLATMEQRRKRGRGLREAMLRVFAPSASAAFAGCAMDRAKRHGFKLPSTSIARRPPVATEKPSVKTTRWPARSVTSPLVPTMKPFPAVTLIQPMNV